MASKKNIFTAKGKMEYHSGVEQDTSSRTERATDSEMEEIKRNERTRLLDGSTGARPKHIAAKSLWEVGSTSSVSSFSDESEDRVEVAYKAAQSALKAAFSCRSVKEIAIAAICDVQKRIDITLEYAEKVHHSHVAHYLAIINKYRSAINLVSESVREAEKAEEKVMAAANNSMKAGNRLSEPIFKPNIAKEAIFWATWATTTAKQREIDAYKAAYVVLKVTRKLWQDVDEAINLETSFKKPVQLPDGTSKRNNVVHVMVFMLGCAIIFINSKLEILNDSEHILFMIGCALIVISLLTGMAGVVGYCTGMARVVGYCTGEETSEEKMEIRRSVQAVEEHLRSLDDYFAKNKITPPSSDLSEDEVDNSPLPEDSFS